MLGENICLKVNDILVGEVFIVKGMWLNVEYLMLLLF